MERERFIKFGDTIHLTKGFDDSVRAEYILVSGENQIVGVALYHFDNPYFTAAIIKEPVQGYKLITHHDDLHPYNEYEITELHRIFEWAFK